MFRVENYILLYINEYVGYIFNNLKGMPRMFPKTKMDIKNNLLKEIKKTVDIYVNDFRPSINKESVTKMKKVTDDINMNDSKHQINFYEIFLEKGKIQIQENNNCIILTICLENVIINQSFDLISYYRNKNSYFEYLTVNNFTDPVVFPEVEKIEEEKPKDENQSKNRRIAIMQAKKVFGEDLSVVPIDVLNFGLRVYNALRRGKVDAIEQLINYYYDYNGFLNIRWISNFGEAEVLDKMKDMGIELKTETFSR